MSDEVGNPLGEVRLEEVMSARVHRVRLPAPDPEDPKTLRGAAAGDEACVRALYRGHVERVHRHVARVLGRHDPDVEDVVQKVFLAALDGAESFGERSKVSSWLMGIATRRALDEARSRWRRDRWARLGERLGQLVGVGRAPSAPDVPSVHRREAEALLQVLTPDQRTVFVLKEVEGHTLQEIADMSGVGISTLHARLQAARKRLDSAIEGGRHA